MQRADGCAVVAVFGVVVILDDEIARPRPFEQRGAAGGGQHDAGRGLMGRGCQHRRCRGVRECRDVESVVVDRDGDGINAVVAENNAVQPESGILHRDGAMS